MEVDVGIVEGTASINKLAEYDFISKKSQWRLIWGIDGYSNSVPRPGIISPPLFVIGLFIGSVVILMILQKKRIK